MNTLLRSGEGAQCGKELRDDFVIGKAILFLFLLDLFLSFFPP